MRVTIPSSCVLLSCLMVPGMLSAQDSHDSRLAERLDAVTLRQVDSLVDMATSTGLPTEPLIQKALEGSSKNASGERIVAAVSQLHIAMKQAQRSLGSSAREPDILAGALSLRAGATPAMLREVARLGRGRDLDVPLGVLADLVTRGSPLAQAYTSVERLMRLGASDVDFFALREQGAPPDSSTGAAAPATILPPGAPAAEPPRLP